MQFLSSKQLDLLSTAFTQIQHQNTISHGQTLLQSLRTTPDYTLLLATLIQQSRCQHSQVLAALELQKTDRQLTLQIMWLLRDSYYRRNQKVSSILGEVVSRRQNIKLAKEMLECNVQAMGIKQITRMIELVYRLLGTQQQQQESLKCLWQQLLWLSGQLKICLQQNEEISLMYIGCLAIFYDASMNYYSNTQKIDQLKSNWNTIRHQIQNYNFSFCQLLQSLLSPHNPLKLQQGFITDLITALYKGIQKNNTIKTRYLSKILSVVVKNQQILDQAHHVLEFISAINMVTTRRHQDYVEMLQYDNKMYVDRKWQLQENSGQQEVMDCIRMYVSRILIDKYSWLVQLYQTQHPNTYILPLAKQLLPLLNVYKQLPAIPKLTHLASTYIPLIITDIQDLLSNQQQIPKERYFQFMTQVQFLTKYHSLISINILPHTTLILGQMALRKPVLSTLCYSFSQDVWEDLAYLSIPDLNDYLYKHLQLLNRNQWGYTIQHYTCFLQLSRFVQQNCSFFSQSPKIFGLVGLTLQTIPILVQLLGSNVSPSMEIYHLVIDLVSSLAVNPDLQQDSSNSDDCLYLSFWTSKIQQYALFSANSAEIVTIHRLKSETLLNCIYQDSLTWQMDQQDYLYKIVLYCRELEYARKDIFQDLFRQMHTNLFNKINIFMNTLSENELEAVKQLKIFQSGNELWSQNTSFFCE